MLRYLSTHISMHKHDDDVRVAFTRQKTLLETSAINQPVPVMQPVPVLIDLYIKNYHYAFMNLSNGCSALSSQYVYRCPV